MELVHLHLRRESYGELVQIDGSEHRWFEDRVEPCSLLVFIDDATSSQIKILNGGLSVGCGHYL